MRLVFGKRWLKIVVYLPTGKSPISWLVALDLEVFACFWSYRV
jgi:hypothetical protein